jgi:hypothetical protein
MKMQATLSFNYPEDEGKLEDAMKATEYKEALQRVEKRIQEHFDHDDSPEFTIASINTIVKLALKGHL